MAPISVSAPVSAPVQDPLELEIEPEIQNQETTVCQTEYAESAAPFDQKEVDEIQAALEAFAIQQSQQDADEKAIGVDFSGF